jgi:hypothetical protein
VVQARGCISSLGEVQQAFKERKWNANRAGKSTHLPRHSNPKQLRTRVQSAMELALGWEMRQAMGTAISRYIHCLEGHQISIFQP